MKKLLFLSIILLACSNAFALNDSEYETARKLYELGVFTKPRTLLEWQAPIKTIDCASAIIKSLSVANDNILDRELFYSAKVKHQNDRIEKNAIEIGLLQEENALLFKLNDELIISQKRQEESNMILWIALFLTNILHLSR